MKILIIPDCHLKPWMFDDAIKIKEKYNVDKIVILGDIADDWNKGFDKDLYEKTFNKLIEIVKKYPDTKICIGNHDYGYLYGLPHSGYSSYVNSLVVTKIKELMSLTDIRVTHRIDNIIFSHAGVCEDFVKKKYELTGKETIDEILDLIEHLPPEELWNDLSPLWVRPQYGNIKMYQRNKYTQVTGHTPTENIYIRNNFISCDVFSTYRHGTPIGNQKFIIVDSLSGDTAEVSEISD